MDDDDVTQGALGDCYFLSALSLVATEEGCCAGLIDDSLDAAGCYGVTLFHKGKWHMVWGMTLSRVHRGDNLPASFTRVHLCT